MTSMQLVGLNTKYYRYQHGLTQEEYAIKLNLKWLTLVLLKLVTLILLAKNIDFIAQSFNITPKDLFDEETAKLAKKLPPRIDMYHK